MHDHDQHQSVIRLQVLDLNSPHYTGLRNIDHLPLSLTYGCIFNIGQ